MSATCFLDIIRDGEVSFGGLYLHDPELVQLIGVPGPSPFCATNR